MHRVVLGFLIGSAVRMLLLAGLIYVTFFVPVGDHTLYGHGSRIAQTHEAQDLWHAVSDIGERTAQSARHVLAEQAAKGVESGASK